MFWALFLGYAAVVPVVCVWLGGIAAMLAEAFRTPDEQMPIGGLGMIGIVASVMASLLLWDRSAESYGVISADNFGLFVTLVLALVGILTIALSGQIVKRDGIPAGEYYALLLFSLGGMMLMAVANDLLIIFLALEISLAGHIRADGDPPRSEVQHRSRVQIFPARRFLERVLSLRHRLCVRRHRQHPAGSHRDCHVRPGRRSRADDIPRAWTAACRLCLQSLRGALPHVDAGRL